MAGLLNQAASDMLENVDHFPHSGAIPQQKADFNGESARLPSKCYHGLGLIEGIVHLKVKTRVLE